MDKQQEPTPTDEQLLQLYLADTHGAEGLQAADQLLGRYHSRVYQWCRSYTSEADDALDLAQEVMINAFNGLKSFDRRARFSSWLFAITRNRCLTAVRLAKQPGISLELLPEPPSGADNAETLMQNRQEEKALRLMIGRDLEPCEEEAFWLRIIEKMSVDQITCVLGLENASGARSVLQRARRKLRRIWGDRMDEFKGVD